MRAEERLYTAISGDVPDRVPVVPKIWVDLAGTLMETPLIEILTSPLTALEVIARAGEACGSDAVRQFHFPKRRIVERKGSLFEIDHNGHALGKIDLQGGLATRLENPETFKLENPYFTAYCQFWSCDIPFVNSYEDAFRIAVPPKKFYEETGCGDRQRTILKKYAGRVAFIGDCGPATLAFLVYLRGMSEALIDLLEQPKLAHRILSKGAEIAVEKGKFNLDLGLRVLRVNDSIGNMSVISPALWRKFVFPHLKDVCTELHAYNSEARIYCHICGNILPIAEDLVETGLDCIGPLDPLGGFAPKDIRRLIGGAAALFGGVNTLTFIESGSETIMKEARRCILEAGRDGGYILSSGCVIPRSAPLENLKALRSASDSFGVYQRGVLAG